MVWNRIRWSCRVSEPFLRMVRLWVTDLRSIYYNGEMMSYYSSSDTYLYCYPRLLVVSTSSPSLKDGFLQCKNLYVINKECHGLGSEDPCQHMAPFSRQRSALPKRMWRRPLHTNQTNEQGISPKLSFQP